MGEEMVKDNKVMTAFEGFSIRELIDVANEESIQREDIVSILSTPNGYMMIYYH